MLNGMFGMLKVLLVLTFFYLTWASVSMALGQAEGLGNLFLPVSLRVVS